MKPPVSESEMRILGECRCNHCGGKLLTWDDECDCDKMTPKPKPAVRQQADDMAEPKGSAYVQTPKSLPQGLYKSKGLVKSKEMMDSKERERIIRQLSMQFPDRPKYIFNTAINLTLKSTRASFSELVQGLIDKKERSLDELGRTHHVLQSRLLLQVSAQKEVLNSILASLDGGDSTKEVEGE